jgi:uncharacterized membrane protein
MTLRGASIRAACGGPQALNRIPVVDAGRGAAVVLMVTYHFCFDLDYFKFVRFDFYQGEFWLAFRTSIVSLFLILVGVALRLSTANGLNVSRFLRRLGILIACAGIVSVASYGMFPASGIFFGVLHFISVASLIALYFLRFHVANLFVGVGCIVVGLSFQAPWFDQPWTRWVGFMTHKPVTEDYVPLFPWFGVVLLGLFVGRLLLFAPGAWERLRHWQPNGPRGALGRVGRHSLAIYMLHQPVLLAVLYVLSR